MGNDVMCLDVDAAKIALLRQGGIPSYEPGLEDLVRRNVQAGRLHFTDDVAQSVAFGDVQFIAVGTPPGEDGSADLKYVLAAAQNIARHMTSRKLIVDKSTVPVGTADKVRAVVNKELAARGVEIPFSVASNPEFLKEGAAINDFMSPDRVVGGGAGAGTGGGGAISSEALAARWPPHALAWSRISLLMTSSFFCASPCTLPVPASPSTPPRAPLLTAMEMLVQARATTAISWRRSALMRPACCSWIRKRVNEVRDMSGQVSAAGKRLLSPVWRGRA
ncbi:hypothetical protein G6F65_018981 [Rhizopus arrhizus]|nr:hypothetical protein G6F65_018981 [Rhizopus arrhizus]